MVVEATAGGSSSALLNNSTLLMCIVFKGTKGVAVQWAKHRTITLTSLRAMTVGGVRR